MTTLSVVLPVRNVEPYLADAFVSLARNADPEFEFIVIDDGSTDATPEIIDDFRDDLPGLRVVRNETSVGLADARNVGLSEAAGRYVTFMDGDDWLAPGYLAQLVAAIERLDCDFVRVDHVQVAGRRRVRHWAPEGRRDVVLKPRDGVLPANKRNMVDYPYAWAGIYRRGLGDLLRFPAQLHTAEDRPWIWRLHREARSFAVAPLAGLFYRRLVATSLTQVSDERQLNFFDAYDLIFDQLDAEPDLLPKAVRQFLALLAHHLEIPDRFTPALRARFVQRARRLVDRLPAEVVAQCWLSEERAEILRPVLAPRRFAERAR